MLDTDKGEDQPKLARMYALRAKLRAGALSRRVRDCGLRSVSFAPGLRITQARDGSRESFWTGVLACGCQSMCPVCAHKRAARRMAELESMMRVVAPEDGVRWQMVTFTVRHHKVQSLLDLLLLLFAAWRRVRAMRRIRRVFSEKVKASVRALEVKFSWENGWHPHFHMLWQTTEWTHHERRMLLREWAVACGQRSDLRYMIHWSEPIESWQKHRAYYLAKLGCEIAGVGKDAGSGSLHPFQLAELALVVHEAADRWREFQLAMKGRRVLEFDERAKALAAAGWEPPAEPVKVWDLELYGEEIQELAFFERFNPTILWRILQVGLSGPDPPAAIEEELRKLGLFKRRTLNARPLLSAA